MPIKTAMCAAILLFVFPALVFPAPTPKSDPVPIPKLLEMAEKKFSSPTGHTLTEAERQLFITIGIKEIGTVAYAMEKGDDIAHPESWNNKEERTINAECLEWLCTDPDASKQVAAHGIDLQGVIIQNTRAGSGLDLDNAQISFPISAASCAFTCDISMADAHLKSLIFEDSGLKSLQAYRAQIDSICSINKRCDINGVINLQDVTIGDNLECQGTTIHGSKDGDGNIIPSLNAEGIKIGGAVHLEDGFSAEGEIDFAGATIGKDLDCSNAVLNGDIYSLDASDSKIGGSCFFRWRFTSSGGINLKNAVIGGDVDAMYAVLGGDNSFFNPALNASRAKIGGNLLLGGFKSDESFKLSFSKANGGIDLTAATITGDVECVGGEYNHDNASSNCAIVARSAQIGGDFFIGKGAIVDGIADFTYAAIGKSFNWEKMTSREKTTLDLSSAKVGELVLNNLPQSWPAHMNLYGLTYDRLDQNSPQNVDLCIAWLHNQDSYNFSPQPYEQLAGVLRNMGYEGHARQVEVKKNMEFQNHVPWGWNSQLDWWWYNVIGWIIGYGYEPGWVFFLSIGWICFGAAVFQWAVWLNLIKATKEGQAARFNSFIYSLESFVPLLKLDQCDNWAPDPYARSRFRWGKWDGEIPGQIFQWYLWFHIILGWVLTTLWIGGLTGLVKT